MSDYQVKSKEKDFVHVRFIKILKEGKRTRDVHTNQMYSVKDFEKFKKTIEELGLAVTQFDEMEVLYDPRNQAQKPTVSEADELRQFLTDNGVEFDSRIGIAKLRALKEEFENN